VNATQAAAACVGLAPSIKNATSCGVAVRSQPLRPALLLTALLWSGSAYALDKQGSAHHGAVGGDDAKAMNVSGSLALGVAVVNPTYAARPDNTGLALMRYAGHVDIDLIGRQLSIPLDVNLFSDRERSGVGRKVAPSEIDFIGGVTTTNAIATGSDLEIGARVEHDRAIDFARHPYTQTYADVRGRLLYSLAKIFPSLGRDLVRGDITGWGTLGWFAFNPTYAARPDNTGLALFRYAGHSEMSVWDDHIAIGLDLTFFSDRDAANVMRPTELDLTYEMILRVAHAELHIAYERDMPLDRRGLIQSFAYLLFVQSFDFRRDVLKK
jgi:hypothetical protein